MAKMFTRTATLGAASVEILGPNPRRSGLILSPPSGNRYSVAFGEAAIIDSGPTMLPDSTPLQLNKDTCGYDLTMSIHAIASAAQAVGFTEVCNP